MPTTSLKVSRYTYDLDGNVIGSTPIFASSGTLPVYKSDSAPALSVTYAYEDGLGNVEYSYGHRRVGATQQPQWKLISRDFLNTDTHYRLYLTEYDPLLWGGYGAEEAFYYPGVPGGYLVNGLHDFGPPPTNVDPINLLLGPLTLGGSSTADNGRYEVFGSASHSYEKREIAVTNLRLERGVVDIQSKNPFARILGDITVYPNQASHGLQGWKPTGDIAYRIKLTSPRDIPGGVVLLDGVIPASQVSDPNTNGVIASIDHKWDGSRSGLKLYCQTQFVIEVRVLANVESGNTTGSAVSPQQLILTNCKNRKFQKYTQTRESIAVFPGVGSEVNPAFDYISSSSAETPASMGYGWFSTENIRVFEVPEDDSLAYCDGGAWIRWLKNGGSYEPMLPDNKAIIVKNPSSTTARYVITWRDGYRREFDDSGRLRKAIDVHGRTTTFDRFASYLKVEDDEGRAVYHHFPSGGSQPTVINDNTDPALGRRYLLSYYGSGDPAPGRLKSITDPAGDQTLFVYNVAGRITERREVRPTEGDRSLFYSYGNGILARLVAVRAASTKAGVTTDHYVINYAYGVAVPGHSGGYTATLMQIRDLESNTATTDKLIYLAYDAYARSLAEFELLKIEGSGSTETRTYLETYHFYEDPNDPYALTKTIAPNGAITQWQYTPRGNLKKIIDAQNNETVFSYVEEDPLHPAFSTFPDLVTQVRRPAPDLENAPTTFYPPTKFTYQASNGDLLSVEDPQGATSHLRYTSLGLVDRVINARGFKTYLEYDAKARISKVHVQKSLVPSPSISDYVDEAPTDFRSLTLFYDDYDNVIEVLDSNGNSVGVSYDEVGRPLTMTDGNNVDRVFEYIDGVLKEVTLPENNVPSGNVRLAKMEYDSAGRVTAVKRQDSSHSPELQVGFAYNGFSQLRALKRLKNGVEKSHTVDSWDRQGRVLQTTDANGKSSSAAYEPYCVGQASTSARGVRIKSSFDTLCRLTKVESGAPDADPLELANVRETRDFQYDDLGRPLKTIQRPPARYGQARFGESRYGGTLEERAFEYDSLDRLTKMTFEDGKEMTYLYDAEGNVTQVTENASGSTPKVTQFSYYGDNKLYQVTYVRSGGNQVFTYTYDPGGRPLTLTYPATTGIVAHFTGPNDEVGWDGNGQLLHLRYLRGTDTIRRFEFTYDASGNRVSQLDVVDIASPPSQRAVKWEYGYDWLDRLETVKKAEAATVGALGALQLVSVYEYDAADNRIEFQVPNLDPDLTETFTYSFDAADNILSISKAVGSGSPSVIETFTSDDDGNLLTRTKSATGMVTTYRWDDFNRLAAISTSDGSKKQSHTFGVNGFRRKKKDKTNVETTEYAAGLATEVSKVQGGDTVTYLMGHQIMGFEKSGNFYWLVQDGLSTTRDVLNSSGSVVASYEFSEYGAKISPANTGGVETQKTFVGGLSVQDEVADTGLMMMGHRFYEPSLGRFLSRDPIGFAGGLNLYSYGNSSPVTFIDPTGLQTGTAVDVVKMASDIVRTYASRVTAAEAAAAAGSAASDGPLPIGDALAILILLRAMQGGHELTPEQLNNHFLGNNDGLLLSPAKTPCPGEKLPIGEDLEFIVRSPLGPIGFLAEIGVDGTDIVLDNVNIYPYGWEKQEGQNLSREIMARRTVLRNWALQYGGGYKNIQLRGIRLGDSTINPGHVVSPIKIPLRK